MNVVGLVAQFPNIRAHAWGWVYAVVGGILLILLLWAIVALILLPRQRDPNAGKEALPGRSRDDDAPPRRTGT